MGGMGIRCRNLSHCWPSPLEISSRRAASNLWACRLSSHKFLHSDGPSIGRAAGGRLSCQHRPDPLQSDEESSGRPAC